METFEITPINKANQFDLNPLLFSRCAEIAEPCKYVAVNITSINWGRPYESNVEIKSGGVCHATYSMTTPPMQNHIRAMRAF